VSMIEEKEKSFEDEHEMDIEAQVGPSQMLWWIELTDLQKTFLIQFEQTLSAIQCLLAEHKYENASLVVDFKRFVLHKSS
jgi:hypothetical protein